MDQEVNYAPIIAITFDLLAYKIYKQPAIKVFIASLINIKKALAYKPIIDLKAKLLD